jgi:capsular polysaccharide biosynthesis protein
MEAMDLQMELDLKDYLYILKKRFWVLAAIVIVACIATGLVSYLIIEPQYQASAKLIVNKQYNPNDQLDLNTVNLNIRLIETYKEIIKTAAIMDKVVERYPELGFTADQLIEKIQVSSVNNTQVMTLSIRDSNYVRAVDTVNAIAYVFTDQIPSIMAVDNVSILNEAKLAANPNPVYPNPILNIAISFVVALMVGVGLVFLLEYLDDTIKTEQDVANILQLPTLGMIPKAKRPEADGESAKATKDAEDVHHATNYF